MLTRCCKAACRAPPAQPRGSEPSQCKQPPANCTCRTPLSPTGWLVIPCLRDRSRCTDCDTAHALCSQARPARRALQSKIISSYEPLQSSSSITDNTRKLFLGQNFDACMCVTQSRHTCTPSISKSIKTKLISNHIPFSIISIRRRTTQEGKVL